MSETPSQAMNALKRQETQILADICAMIESNLGLPENAIPQQPGAYLLGAIPELDSMSVVSILISIEEFYEISIYDDEIDASVFQTIGSLVTFVKSKLG